MARAPGTSREGGKVQNLAKTDRAGRTKAKAKGKVNTKINPKSKIALKTAKKARASEKLKSEIAPSSEAPAKGLGGFRRKVLEYCGEKTIEETILDQQTKKQCAETKIAEVEALNAAMAETLSNARQEYENSSELVESAIKEELRTAEAFNAAQAGKAIKDGTVAEARKTLGMVQKKFAKLEVLAINCRKKQEFEKAKIAATEAAKAATLRLKEKKMEEKELFEKTKREIAEQKAKLNEAYSLAKRSATTVPVVGMDLD